ncbi:Poly(A)-specific ribonuclease PARN [Coccomyxa sp. Obi]|nr:Poly(A)-specific ribonuclease PARN [Coccomyxa sp. Obi]
MDVTRNTFAKALPLVEKALERCQFYSFDLEMTGLHVTDKREDYLDDIQDRYEVLAEGAQNFLVSQFGLSFFCWEGGKYAAQTFNFYLFPLPMLHGQDKRFLCQAGSMDFLASQGFDFNKFVYEGIPFMCVADRDRRLEGISREPCRSGISIHKPEDVAFVAALVQQVSAWLQGSGTELILEEVNGYQRAIQYQQLEKPQFGAADPPGFYFEACDGPQGKRAIRLTRASAAEVEAFNKQKKQVEAEKVHAAAGFCSVLERLRDSRKPAVGHNCAFDLTFTLEHLAQSLPAEWPSFKRLVQAWFPGGIWDTKYLIKQLPELFQALPSTSLQPLYQALNPGGPPEPQVREYLEKTGGQLPRVEHASAFARYTGPDAASHAHEAGYDAYMTGAVFACLLQLHASNMASNAGGTRLAAEARLGGAEVSAMSARGLVSDIEQTSLSAEQPDFCGVQELMGRVNIMFSPIPYTAVYGEDPVPNLDHIFYVSGLGQGTKQSDLQRVFDGANLGRMRLNLKSRGTQAVVELLDRGASPQAVKLALCSLLSLSPEQVLTSAEFAAQKASGQLSKQPHGGWAAASEKLLSNGAARPVKRPRTDDDVDMAPVQQAEPSAARSKRCIIM